MSHEPEIIDGIEVWNSIDHFAKWCIENRDEFDKLTSDPRPYVKNEEVYFSNSSIDKPVSGWWVQENPRCIAFFFNKAEAIAYAKTLKHPKCSDCGRPLQLKGTGCSCDELGAENENLTAVDHNTYPHS